MPGVSVIFAAVAVLVATAPVAAGVVVSVVVAAEAGVVAAVAALCFGAKMLAAGTTCGVEEPVVAPLRF
jgi:hypothetical protein